MKKELIKVGFCVAYDWYLLQHSIPLIYKHADVICLSLDIDRKSWGGNTFTWDEEGFRELVRELDPENKIDVYEDDFHLTALTPGQNEVRQRKLIAERMGEGGWHLQLDADEFFINFTGFLQYLQQLKPRRKVNVVCPLINLYKQDADGFYYVKSTTVKDAEFIQIASLWPHYEYGRRNGYFNIYTDFAILHLSWARSKEEIWEKLNNWGHKDDFNIERYYKQWADLNAQNYSEYKNFHHLVPAAWPALGFIQAADVEDLMQQVQAKPLLPLSRYRLKMQNSIWVSRLKKVLRKNK